MNDFTTGDEGSYYSHLLINIVGYRFASRYFICSGKKGSESFL